MLCFGIFIFMEFGGSFGFGICCEGFWYLGIIICFSDVNGFFGEEFIGFICLGFFIFDGIELCIFI